MTFEQLLDAAVDLLLQPAPVTYGALKRQFGLDDAMLADLANELIRGQPVAADEDGVVLVWCGPDAAAAAPTTAPRNEAERRS